VIFISLLICLLEREVVLLERNEDTLDHKHYESAVDI